MSTEKMREFKAWWLDDQQAELRSSCAEGWALIIWQASRAAVEVELPEVDTWSHYSEGMAIYKRECRGVMESLGLKVKP